jgi:PAS domain S-box-containing protein
VSEAVPKRQRAAQGKPARPTVDTTAPTRSASHAALVYAVIAGLWILVDRLVPEWSPFAGLHILLALSTIVLLHLFLLRELRGREQAQHAAQSSAWHLVSLLETAPDAIVALDARQRVYLFNQGAQRIFGYSASEVLGQPFELLFPEHQAPRLRGFLDRLCSTDDPSAGASGRWEVVGRRRDGSEFPAEASISRRVQDRHSAFTVILQDITQRQQYQADLRQAREHLERRVLARLRLFDSGFGQFRAILAPRGAVSA